MLLLGCLFGYMDVLILVKWLTDWSGDPSRAPSIVGMMVNMFLKYGALDPNEDAILGEQELINKVLLLVIFVTPCWMLLVKPIILN